MSKKPSEIRLGRLELQIMNVVWDRETASVHDVKDALTQGRKPAYSTILTMMRKLEAKGYLTHEVDDRTFVYHATVSRQTARHGLLGDLLDRVFEGSPALLDEQPGRREPDHAGRVTRNPKTGGEREKTK